MSSTLLSALILFSAINSSAAANECPLYVGWATADITPDKPVNLVGQMTKRISQGVLDPLTATALALETRDETGTKEQAIMISYDLVWTRKEIQQRLQKLVGPRIPDFDVSKLFLRAYPNNP